MAQKPDERHSSETDSLDVNRRQVLQGIGAAGAAATITTGSASAQGSDIWKAQAAVTDQEMDDIPISTQFYSYRSTDLSVPELIQAAADAGYDAFEPYSVGAGTNVDPILQAANDTGLEMSSAHISLSEVENNTQAMIDTFSQFGDPILIDPGVAPSGGWGDESAVIDLAERFNAAADLLSDTDLTLGHHNHDAEFAQIGDTTGYDIFAENLDDQVHIQLDVGWVLVGGADPIRFIADHPENVQITHMKNMTVNPQAFTEIHEGTSTCGPSRTPSATSATPSTSCSNTTSRRTPSTLWSSAPIGWRKSTSPGSPAASAPSVVRTLTPRSCTTQPNRRSTPANFFDSIFERVSVSREPQQSVPFAVPIRSTLLRPKHRPSTRQFDDNRVQDWLATCSGSRNDEVSDTARTVSLERSERVPELDGRSHSRRAAGHPVSTACRPGLLSVTGRWRYRVNVLLLWFTHRLGAGL